MTSIDRVLGEFQDAWNAGRRPDVDDYLGRVGRSERDELAFWIDSWLLAAGTPDYDDETLEQIRQEPMLVAALAAAEPAPVPWSARLPALRKLAGLAIGDVAERLTTLVGAEGQEPRAAEYLERLERDDLDGRRVSRRLVGALASILGADPDELELTRMLSTGPQPAGQAFFRAEDNAGEWIAGDIDVLSQAAMAPAPAPLDELDKLFVGGPDG